MTAALKFAQGVAWRFGFALRESGQALERVGCQLQGIFSHREISESPGLLHGLLQPPEF